MDNLQYEKQEKEVNQVIISLYQEPEVSIPIPQKEQIPPKINQSIFSNFIPKIIKNPFK